MSAENKQDDKVGAAPIPDTGGSGRRYNAERHWRGRSYRKGGKPIRQIRYDDVTDDDEFLDEIIDVQDQGQ